MHNHSANPLAARLKHLTLNSPLLTASGTSGSCNEMGRMKNHRRILHALGAFVTKGVTLEPKRGNPEIRVMEIRTGLMNSIGLQNSGAAGFLQKELPQLESCRLPILVNISASTIGEFGKLAAYLRDNDREELIAGLEINVSCPNLHAGGMAFGVDPRLVERVVKTVRRHSRKDWIVITKLSPNVTDITLPARAAIEGGTDVLSMINTVRGMAVNIETRKPFLGNVVGGLSGPAIKPVGVLMVYQCFTKIPECRSLRVPIIGIGGIACWQDALEYILAGATATGIGTAWFVNPNVFIEVRDGLEKYLSRHRTTLAKLVGKACDC
ncbi:MAG: dihydroorotate dehydrogenase [Verrucomicrobiae bacterium]|nr:dihydroorotate dehydrogenase [Verrucomicrobiae bacterium]